MAPDTAPAADRGGTGGGPEADDAAWELAWDVNVMAHVRAARALLPEWLERGEGRFVSTVSAAGLLTMIGAAPYSVTKHGALAFADALRLEGDLEALMDRAATGAGARAVATVLLVGPLAEAGLGPARAALAGARGGASLMRERVLLARLLAADSLTLRRTLVPLITALAGAPPPRVWAL